jgi:hypothetical protein
MKYSLNEEYHIVR